VVVNIRYGSGQGFAKMVRSNYRQRRTACHRVQRMDDLWQQALADVVRAELALTGRTAKDAYTALGISSTAWQTYFKRQTRDIPSRVLLDLAAYLGMPLSELSARAEARAVSLDSPSVSRATAELEAGLSRSGRRALEQARAEQAERMGDAVRDPFERARADQDDGAIGRSATG
jgi:hypothetical protein